MSVPELFDPDFKYRLLTLNIERAVSLQRIWEFGLLVPYSARSPRQLQKGGKCVEGHLPPARAPVEAFYIIPAHNTSRAQRRRLD